MFRWTRKEKFGAGIYGSRTMSRYFYLILDDLWNRFRISVSAWYADHVSSRRLIRQRTSSNAAPTRHRLIISVTIIWETEHRRIFQSRELWQHRRHRNDGIVMGNGTFLIECKIYGCFFITSLSSPFLFLSIASF